MCSGGKLPAMAKKKAKKKLTKTKATSGRKRTAAKKGAGKKLAKKKSAPKKRSGAKRILSKKTAAKKSPAKTKQRVSRSASAPTRESRRESPFFDNEKVDLQERRSRSAGQSGGLQGLSDIESADSESVDELVEEGNAFEADVVAGVERAGDADEQEVHTHEVPEDDVPGEYLDEE
ncbi:MAG: hypothetical protein QOD84_2201 [Acidobacteriaceae bacterium]|jgi:hypothetical protein